MTVWKALILKHVPVIGDYYRKATRVAFIYECYLFSIMSLSSVRLLGPIAYDLDDKYETELSCIKIECMSSGRGRC